MHRCSCHDRPISLLYKGYHEVWYSSDTVYRGSWLDGNWHGRGQWVVGRKLYLGHWVCGLFTAIMSFKVVFVCVCVCVSSMKTTCVFQTRDRDTKLHVVVHRQSKYVRMMMYLSHRRSLTRTDLLPLGQRKGELRSVKYSS